MNQTSSQKNSFFNFTTLKKIFSILFIVFLIGSSLLPMRKSHAQEIAPTPVETETPVAPVLQDAPTQPPDPQATPVAAGTSPQNPAQQSITPLEGVNNWEGGYIELYGPSGIVNNPNPTFSWYVDFYSPQYELYVDNQYVGTFSDYDANCPDGWQDCSITPSLQLKAGLHSWKIIAYDDHWDQIISDPMNFTQTCLQFGFNLEFNGSMLGSTAAQGTWAVNATSLYSNALKAVVGPVPGPHYQASAFVNQNYTNTEFEIQLMRTGCETCASKIYVRGDGIPVFAGWKNGYQFNYKRNGQFYVGKTINGTLYTLKNWTYSGAIKRGTAWNKLKVLNVGYLLEFYINDVKVYSTSDRSRGIGRVGASLYSNVPTNNRLYVNYAKLTTNPLGIGQAASAGAAGLSADLAKPDPRGGNW